MSTNIFTESWFWWSCAAILFSVWTWCHYKWGPFYPMPGDHRVRWTRLR